MGPIGCGAVRNYVGHRQESDVGGLDRAQACALQLRLQVGEGVAPLQCIRDLEQDPIRVLLSCDPPAQRVGTSQNRLAPCRSMTGSRHRLQDRLRQELHQLATVANMPVERGGLYLELVRQRPHREPFQALLVDQLEGCRDQPLPRQTALLLFFWAQFRDSPLFLIVGLAYLTLLGLFYASNAPNGVRSRRKLRCRRWKRGDGDSRVPRWRGRSRAGMRACAARRASSRPTASRARSSPAACRTAPRCWRSRQARGTSRSRWRGPAVCRSLLWISAGHSCRSRGRTPARPASTLMFARVMPPACPSQPSRST